MVVGAVEVVAVARTALAHADHDHVVRPTFVSLDLDVGLHARLGHDLLIPAIKEEPLQHPLIALGNEVTVGDLEEVRGAELVLILVVAARDHVDVQLLGSVQGRRVLGREAEQAQRLRDRDLVYEGLHRDLRLHLVLVRTQEVPAFLL